MSASTQPDGARPGGGYEFLDSGDQRRLERVDGVLVSRPAPAAAHRRGLPDSLWHRAALSFDRSMGWAGDVPENWHIEVDGVTLGLRPGGGGQIGVFPEHARPASRVLEILSGRFSPERSLSALNLFSHTGLATLRLASRSGTSVTHIDSSAAAVRMAKRNAVLSGLQDRPIRWLVNDVMKFCQKESKRGAGYDVVVVDPPSFGRGNRGESWKLERDLPLFLDVLQMLLNPDGVLCLTCHSEGWTRDVLCGAVRSALGERARMESEELWLHSFEGGMSLRSGLAVYVALSG